MLYALQIFDFLTGELAVVSRSQMAKTDISDSYAFQLLNGIPDSRKHLADLAVLTFMDGNLHNS